MTVPAADSHRYDLPWLFAAHASAEERRHQSRWQQTLLDRGVRHIGEGTYLSPLAAIHDTDLRIGRDSYMTSCIPDGCAGSRPATAATRSTGGRGSGSTTRCPDGMPEPASRSAQRRFPTQSCTSRA
jgi:hypothetical protein